MSIYQRQDRGNSWWVDLRIDGRRIRRRAPVQTEEGAQELELQIRREAAHALEPDTFPLSSRSTFADFAEHWLSNYVMIANRGSTVREKRSVLRARLLPAFGHLPLAEITTNTVDAQVAVWMRNGLGLKRINNIATVLRKALRCAVEWGLLERAPIVRHHRYFPPVPQFLTRSESDRVLAEVAPGFWRTLVLFLLTTGARFGEAAALRWEDIELRTDRPFVLIRRSVCYGVVSEPKTAQSRRAIALIPEVVAALRALRQERSGAEWVFTSPSGRFLDPGRSCHVLKRACIKAGVPVISWHKLRHSCATQLMAEGVPLVAIKEVLGHTNIDVTSIYTHVTPSSLWGYMQLLSRRSHVPTGDHVPHVGVAA